MVAQNQRSRTTNGCIVERGTSLVGDFENIAKTFGRDQTDSSTGSSNYGIGGHGGSVHKPVDRANIALNFSKSSPNAIDHGVVRRTRRRGHFPNKDVTFWFPNGHVGKRASGIYCYLVIAVRKCHAKSPRVLVSCRQISFCVRIVY